MSTMPTGGGKEGALWRRKRTDSRLWPVADEGSENPGRTGRLPSWHAAQRPGPAQPSRSRKQAFQPCSKELRSRGDKPGRLRELAHVLHSGRAPPYTCASERILLEQDQEVNATGSDPKLHVHSSMITE
jgi:hypothetical protein